MELIGRISHYKSDRANLELVSNVQLINSLKLEDFFIAHLLITAALKLKQP